MVDKNKVFVEEELKDLIPNFLNNRNEEVEKLNKALDIEDYDTIERIGHVMKGVGGGYGFDYITELGHRIEQAAKKFDKTALKTLLKEYDYHLNNVEIIYE